MSETETKQSEEPTEQAAEAEVVEAEAEPTREEQLEQELAKVREQMLRTAADYENFRKRTRRDIEDANRKGLERALLEVLPVADNLERALGVVESSADPKAIVDGVEMVLRSFSESLERLGVERVPGEGQPFDPNVHEAIQQVPSEDAAPGTVVNVLVPGYRLGSKLLRAAMVAVATGAPKAPPAEPPGSPGSDGDGQPG